MRPVGAAASIVLAATLAATAVAGAREPAARAPESDTYAVGLDEETFVDRSRPTPPNRSYAGSPDRELDTAIYYPAIGPAGSGVVTEGATPNRRRGPYPVIVLSHGNGSSGRAFEQLIEQWVSAGYVVAAPDYPLSRNDAPGGNTAADVGNQAADASFVLDRVLRLNRTKSSGLFRVMEPDRIGAAGHSLGAVTTYNLVYGTCCVDRRVKAAVAMAGGAGAPPEFFTGINTPLLVLHGDADAAIPYRTGADAFASAGPPKYFVTLIGGQHTPPFRGGDDATATAVTRTTLDFFDRYLKGDRSGLDRLRRDADVAGVAALQEER